MVRMAVLAAWAELQVASSEQAFLVDVLRPRLSVLTPLWLDSLREFARLRFEPDISMTLGPPSLSGSLETVYAALSRETLLAFYQDTWLKLVDAIASLIEQDSDFVFDALDGRESSSSSAISPSPRNGPVINYRDEPVAFFFVLFGLAFEALATSRSTVSSTAVAADSLAGQQQTLAILRALKKILHPSVSGLAIYRDAIFSETMDLLDRLVLTDGLAIQAVIVDIARSLCLAHPSARPYGVSSESQDLSDDIEQLFELTRIIVLVLSGLLPNLASANQPQRHAMTDEAIALIRSALDALVDTADVFPVVIRNDLHACIVHIFATILATPACQEVIVPQALSTLRRFIAGMTSTEEQTSGQTPMYQIHGCLGRFLSIYDGAQRRDTPTSLACVRNCLLACTFVVIGCKTALDASDPLVARYLDQVIDSLTDRMVRCRRILLSILYSRPHNS